MNLRVRKDRLALAALALFHTMLLQFAYVTYVSPLFADQGMTVRPLPFLLTVLQLVLALLPLPWLPIEIHKPSQFQVWLLYLVVYIPSVVVGYHICEVDVWGTYTVYLAVTAVGLIAIAQVPRFRPIRIPVVRLRRWPLVAMLAIFSVITYAILLTTFGLPDDIFSVGDIYGDRQAFKEKNLAAPTLVNYLYFWQGLVINPLLVILGLLRRNALLVVIGVALQYLLFTITTLRTWLLAVGFTIFVVGFFLLPWRKKGLLFMAFIAGSAAIATFLVSGDSLAAVGARIFLQRWLTIQGQLTGAYVDYFSSHSHLFFGDAILRGLVSYEYGDLTPGEVIGDNYVSLGRNPISNATVNFWADAFAHFGLVGVIVASALAMLILWVIDGLFDRMPRGIAVMLFSTCALSLTEQGLQTSLLTGGIVPLVGMGILTHRAFRNARRDEKSSSALDLGS